MSRLMPMFAAFFFAIVAPLLAADAPAKAKFPAPQVDQILKGWAGTHWGTSLDAFKKKFADARELESKRWVTGGGTDDLGGVKVKTEYGFNKKGELYLVRLDPVDPEDRKDLKTKLAAAGLLKDGSGNWKNGSVSFVVATVDKEQFAMAIDAKFVDPKETK